MTQIEKPTEKPYSYVEQIAWVLLFEAVLIAALTLIATFFWTSICTDGLKNCAGTGSSLAPVSYLLLAALRPFVFTPFFFMAILAAPTFGTTLGVIMAMLGGLLSTAILTGIGTMIGRRIVAPWLATHLPQSRKFLQTHDYKIAFFLRLVPLVPFDVASLVFGLFSFRWRHVVWTTMLGSLPEIFVFVRMGAPDATLTESAYNTVGLVAIAILMPLLIGEYLSRKKGRSMWQMALQVVSELRREVIRNNRVKSRTVLSPERTPILLLHGFFSSRRALGILEQHLKASGFDVISFNLGGLLGVFFTSSILDTALLIDEKIKRLVARKQIRKVHIVAHSKGGLVALWWVLKMGGNRFCERIITLGTPFSGTNLTYLALITPLGLFWRDMWQMRPSSGFLQHLHRSIVPENVKVFCFNSNQDAVATGAKGIFRPDPPSENVFSVELPGVTHFSFLTQREVTRRITSLLQTTPADAANQPSADSVVTEGSL